MAYHTTNTYKVIFKDGSSFESNGSEESQVKDFSIKEDFDFISFHITSKVIAMGKEITDIVKIEYSLSIQPNEK